jgi:hypothetical protein
MLATEAEERDIGGAPPSRARVAGAQRRLAVALTFMPPDVFILFCTRDLTTCSPDEITRDQIDKARGELLTLFARIDDNEFSIRQVAPQSLRAERVAKGDL